MDTLPVFRLAFRTEGQCMSNTDWYITLLHDRRRNVAKTSITSLFVFHSFHNLTNILWSGLQSHTMGSTIQENIHEYSGFTIIVPSHHDLLSMSSKPSSIQGIEVFTISLILAVIFWLYLTFKLVYKLWKNFKTLLQLANMRMWLNTAKCSQQSQLLTHPASYDHWCTYVPMEVCTVSSRHYIDNITNN